MTKIEPTDARFIKLGRKGSWEKSCIEANPGTIRLGFNNPLHHECIRGEWDTVHDYWLNSKKKTPGKATEITNQIKDFYTLDESTLWVTFYRRQLYWCFAQPDVRQDDDGTRSRETISGWRCKSVGGGTLSVETLSGTLTKTQGFRGTICSLDAFDYLTHRLNDELLPEVETAQKRLKKLEATLAELIRSLNWKDFELLCDLIFSNAGWQRIATLGGTEKGIDLDLLSPVTGRRLFVQVKSQSNKKTFLKYLAEFDAHSQYDELYFIVHSPKGDVRKWSEGNDPKIKVFSAQDIARLTVSADLIDWLIKKCS